jgi:hypothetical protein
MHPFLPVLTLIFWTFTIGVMTGYSRRNAIAAKRLRIKDVALVNTAWPDDVLKWGNNFNNLFQVPLLFYVLMIMAAVLQYSPPWFIVVAWLFVASRIIHSIIHVTKNNVGQRFITFIIGNILNMALAVGLFLKVLA